MAITKEQCKHLAELFDNDVQLYGDNAYLMWEYQPCVNADYENFDSNDEVLNCIWALTRRKQSAALPFDLWRAKASDIVEYLNLKGDWLVLENHQFISNIDDMITTVLNHANYVTHVSNLRMKYPPRVVKNA